MLGQRLRRWPNIEPALAQWLGLLLPDNSSVSRHVKQLKASRIRGARAAINQIRRFRVRKRRLSGNSQHVCPRVKNDCFNWMHTRDRGDFFQEFEAPVGGGGGARHVKTVPSAMPGVVPRAALNGRGSGVRRTVNILVARVPPRRQNAGRRFSSLRIPPV